MDRPPQIDDAPGLVWRQRKTTWSARWQARTDLVQRGFQPKSATLWVGKLDEITETVAALIHDGCERLQSEMLVWGRGGIPVEVAFDGTLKTLVHCYQTDDDSTYRKARYASRQYYNRLCSRIVKDYGDTELAEIKGRNLMRWHEAWTGSGVTMAHSLMGMMRMLINFGATILEDEECERLSGVLHKMKFKMATPRTARLSADQANAIRAMAHAKGRPSIALAQAFQFECILRQKDVIGEWVPMPEPGTSEVHYGNNKWLRGIRWSEIDGDLILRHTTSKRQKDVEFDLKLAPMVMEELRRLPEIPTSGPVIVNEASGVPWDALAFRRKWREFATKCGIPKTVRNMDSRAGAISEATDAGAELEHVRQAATHGDIAMTQRYSRGAIDNVSGVARKRTAHRNKTGT